MQLQSGVDVLTGNPSATTSDSSKRKRPTPPVIDQTSEWAPLTAHNLRRHNRSQAEAMGKTPSASVTTRSSNITTTSPQFPTQLQANGVVENFALAMPPNDIEDLKTFLDKRRDSPPPTEVEWLEFASAVSEQDNEESMLSVIWPGGLTKRRPLQSQYREVYNMAWPNASGVNPQLTARLSHPKPDYYEAWRFDNYPAHAREALDGHIGPSAHLGAMPVFAAEVKSTNDTLEVAKYQCAYYGAIMVSAAEATQRYLQKPVLTGNTQAITAAFNGSNVNIHLHHNVERPGQRTEFHCYKMWQMMPCNSYEDYKDSYRRVRNSQDWAYNRATQTLKDIRAFAPMPTPPVWTGSAPAEVAELAESSTVSALPPPTPCWVWSARKNDFYCRFPDGSVCWKSDGNV